MTSGVRHTRNLRRTAVVLGVVSALCLGLLAAHSSVRGVLEFNGLPKNLALAWIPLLLSLLLLAAYERGLSRLTMAFVGGLWLLFLPNAPYIVTDFVHVSTAPTLSMLADAALVSVFAATGLGLGFASVLVVHGVAQSLAGRTAGWLCGIAAIGLSGVGVYLGRVHRLNSWDALEDPLTPAALLAQRLVDPLGHGRFYVAVVAYTVVAVLLYILLYRSGRSLIGDERQPPARTSLGST